MKGKVVFLILLLDCNGSNQLGIRSSLFISHRQKHHLWKELKLKYWTKGQRLTKYVIHVILQDLLLQPLVFSQSQEISSVVDYPLIKVAKLLCWLVFFFFLSTQHKPWSFEKRELRLRKYLYQTGMPTYLGALSYVEEPSSLWVVPPLGR